MAIESPVSTISKADRPAEKAHLRAKYETVAEKEWSGSPACRQRLQKNLATVIHSFKCIAGFRALKSEPDLTELFSRASQDSGTSFVYPKVDAENLRFYRVENESQWQAGPLGLQEPNSAECKEVASENIEAYVVPGLAFDRTFVRLGRGRGFYDRHLANSTAVRIGVCAAAQIHETDLPSEAHDERMNYIVTEKFILKKEIENQKKLNPEHIENRNG